MYKREGKAMSVKEKECVEKLPKYKLAKSLKSISLEYGIEEKDIIKLAGNENRYGCSKKDHCICYA